MSDWTNASVPQLYKQCIASGHQPYVHSTGFGAVTLYCEKCPRFWRVEAKRLSSMPVEKWPGKKPAPYQASDEPETEQSKR